MPPSSPPHSTLGILEILQGFIARHPAERISVRELVTYVGEHGLLFLLLLFALLCAVPLPIPGIHVFLSMPLFYVTVQQMAGRHTLWLPEKILDRTLPRTGFVILLARIAPWLHRLASHLQPRWVEVCHGAGYRVMGAIAFFITCIILIPLPLTNVVPALSISLMALAMLCHDGVAALIGAAMGLIWCFGWLALVFYLGWEGMSHIYVFLWG